jgi:hypothetical protein
MFSGFSRRAQLREVSYVFAVCPVLYHNINPFDLAGWYSDNALVLYSPGSGFESQPGYQLYLIERINE